MILYHGSTVVVKNPKILRDDKGRDFGYAFYLTPIEEQAISMAKRKKEMDKINGINSKSIVNIYEWDENIKNLKFKVFKETNEEWVDLIVSCRKKPNFNHGFDIVEGKIADDKVGVSVTLYINGFIDKPELIKKLKYQKINNQIAFCSDGSLKIIKFIKSYEVK